jgi:hypothetical protein
MSLEDPTAWAQGANPVVLYLETILIHYAAAIQSGRIMAV